MRPHITAIIIAIFCLFASFVIWPQIDLIVSGWFYQPDKGFFLADQPVFLFFHWLAYYGARVLGIGLAVLYLAAMLKKKPVLKINSKGWLFLALGLLLAPCLVANVVLKDHWGRARPRDVIEFGGAAHFSPALEPQAESHKNGSFVSGDAAFGFFVPAFAYVVPRRLSRRVFWGGMGVGVLLGFTRLAMGAHFLSDVFFAAFLMFPVLAGLHAALFGAKATRGHWKSWLY